MTAKRVLEVAGKYVGAGQYGSVHRGLIDRYNRVLPRPGGYKMTYEDAWCDAFVTAIADEAGASSLIGRECGVERHIQVCRGLGIWLGRVRPLVGDLVMFDWDGGGFADHIGYVCAVAGDRFQTIEGNSNARVERNWFVWNDWRVKGFARPKYGVVGGGAGASDAISGNVMSKTGDALASEVLLGIWGNHPERALALTSAGYDAVKVQAKVNQLLRNVGTIGAGSGDGAGAAKIKRVRVLPTAMKFYTGESIDGWVKGTTFDVLDQKTVGGQMTYLLGYRGGLIGWVRWTDVQAM